MSSLSCPKCFRSIEAFYYHAHVAACQGPDPYVPLEVIRFIAKGEPQASAPGIAPTAPSVAVSPPKLLSMPAAPATTPRGSLR